MYAATHRRFAVIRQSKSRLSASKIFACLCLKELNNIAKTSVVGQIGLLPDICYWGGDSH